MARRIVHIHIHRHTRDAAPTPREALVERLLELIDKEEARNRASTKDEKEGHEFHGNQYTQVAGVKPTTVSTKHSKKAVHELLSSGHPFSIKELMDITGAQEITVKTALSVLKNEKYASGLGLSTLSIKKHADGTFQLMEGGQPAAKTEVPDLDDDLVAVPMKTPEPSVKAGAPLKKVQTTNPPPAPEAKTAQPSSPVAQPPATPMPKEQADKVYKKSLHDATLAAVAGASGGDFTPHQAAKLWKAAKAQHMAQWAANTKGTAYSVTPTEVFPEDVDLIENLLNVEHDTGSIEPQDIEMALQMWKDDTAAAKHKKATTPAPGPTATKAPTPASHKPGPATVSHETPAAMKVPEAKGTHLKAPESIRPKDFYGVDHKDFASGPNKKPKFAGEMSKLHTALFDGHENSPVNKAEVVSKLKARLKDSPHFQHWSKLYQGQGVQSSLESRLIGTWASSSGDHRPLSVAMQHATQQAFGMDKKQVEWGALSGGHDEPWEDATKKGMASVSLGGHQSNPTPQQVESFHTALKDFVLAQYHETQAHLKELGVTEVCVARGMAGHAGQTGDHVKLKLQPASSFSTDLKTARNFSKGHAVYFSKVPASQVLSSFRSGFGCTNEHEVVVLSHPDTTAAVLSTSAAQGALPNVCAKIGKETSWHLAK